MPLPEGHKADKSRRHLQIYREWVLVLQGADDGVKGAAATKLEWC